jgi:hypothetical protein
MTTSWWGIAERSEADKRRMARARGKGGFTLLGITLGIIPCPYPLAMSLGEGSPDPTSTPTAWWQILRYPQVYLQSAELRLEISLLLLFRTPLVPHVQLCLLGKELLGAASPSVACFLATAYYGPSLPRGLLRRLRTSPSSPHAAGALGKGKLIDLIRWAFTVEIIRALQS